jgi:hypothetical protein
MIKDERLSAELIALCGEDGLRILAEQFGGRRLYIGSGEEAMISQALGPEFAARIAARYARNYLRIPLTRAMRARHYRLEGLSNGAIATKLQVTETAVNKMFAKMDRAGTKPVKGGQMQLPFLDGAADNGVRA